MIDVTNVGIKNGEKSEAKAIAWIGEKECPGRLFVSFFRPIKSQYNIIKLDEKNYDYAVVTSSSKKYLWILSRTPEISDKLYDDLISFAADKGFDTSKIIKVNQDKN